MASIKIAGIVAACVGMASALGGAAAPAAAQAQAFASTRPAHEATLRAAVDGKQRTQPNAVRDSFRKPFEVLQFLGVRPDSKLIEISPGAAGYWTEILAPYLKDKGLYIAANPRPQSPAAKEGVARFNKQFADKLAADPASYGKVMIIEFAPELIDFAAPGSVDFVLTFRNLHNWMDRGVADKALISFHRALKNGGILGIKDHRGRTDQPQDPLAKSGYVRQDYTIELVEKAGFKFAGASEVVANSRDTKDHPAGVWTLPPTYRLKEQDRAKYQSIGESDRYLLKFVKP